MKRSPWSRAAQIALLLACPLLVGGNDDLASRRQRVLGMTPAEQSKLATSRDQFAALDGTEQARMRQLCRDIEQDANSEQLQQVMHRYCQWLKALPSNQRYDLVDMPVDERLATIKKLKQDAIDEEGLRRWFEKYRTRPAQQTPQDQPSTAPPSERGPRRPGGPLAWMEPIRKAWTERLPRLTSEDLAALRAELFLETRKELEKQSLDEQRHWVGKHIREMFQEAGISRWFSRGSSGTWVEVSDDELAKYFEGDELSAELRDELLALPGKEMYDRLRTYYQWRAGGGLPRGGPHPDGPPRDHSSRPTGPPPERSNTTPPR